MLQIVEQGLQVGDPLPEFALPDTDGVTITSEALLARGPLAVVFIRGTWCPYCSLTLEALEEVRPAIEQLGASLVAISPMPREELGAPPRARPAPAAAERPGRRLRQDLRRAVRDDRRRISTSIAAWAGTSERLNAGSGWELPVRRPTSPAATASSPRLRRRGLDAPRGARGHRRRRGARSLRRPWPPAEASAAA